MDEESRAALAVPDMNRPRVRVPARRLVAGFTLPWMAWLVVLTAGLPTPPDAPVTHHLGTALTSLWVSPLVTVPVALWIVHRQRDDHRPWFAENRWTFAGFLTAVAMSCAGIAASAAGVVQFALGGASAVVLVEPWAGLLLVAVLTALPLWFTAAALAIGPGGREVDDPGRRRHHHSMPR